MSEIWRPIPGTDGIYEASDLGRIRSIWVLRPWKSIPRNDRTQRRAVINILQDGESKSFYVHRLVALAFHGPCPPGKQVNHKDGNALNNSPDNLEYVTPSENLKHAYRTGLMRHPARIENTRHHKQVCKNGHPMVGANVRLDKRGRYTIHRCRECERDNKSNSEDRPSAGSLFK